MANASVLYVHDRDYFSAENDRDLRYLDRCEEERLANVTAWRLKRGLGTSGHVRFNHLATALQKRRTV